MGFYEQWKMAFISVEMRKTGQNMRGTKTILGYRDIRNQMLREQRNKPIYFRGTRERVPPLSLRRHRTTKVMTYNYSKFTIVIQAMMFKQMLVRYKLFVLRSDASKFTANIVSPEYFTKVIMKIFLA